MEHSAVSVESLVAASASIRSLGLTGSRYRLWVMNQAFRRQRVESVLVSKVRKIFCAEFNRRRNGRVFHTLGPMSGSNYTLRFAPCVAKVIVVCFAD